MDQVTGAKKDEVKKQLAVYEDHLKNLEKKSKELEDN
jgi:hypothetical protein